ncbi:MAG: carbon storage regulator CsrA [Calditrichia bacterium]
MLVLTRKLGENIVIGDNISIKVINIDNNKVQLGIQAPASLTIYRLELIDRVREQNQSAVVFHRTDLIQAARHLKNLLNVRF